MRDASDINQFDAFGGWYSERKGEWRFGTVQNEQKVDTGTRYTDVKKSFSAACRRAGITDFRFHDLRHTFGTRLADAGVDVVKIKELMGHASIVTTMRYIHATDQGKRGAITVLSEYRQRHLLTDCRKFVAKEKRQTVQPAASR